MDPVAICNLALADLGVAPISSLDDPQKGARLCSTYFPIARDAVLEDRDWTFATKRFVLPLAADPVPFGYAGAYKLPAEVIRVVSAAPPGGTGGFRYAKEGRILIASQAAERLNVVAIVRVEAPDDWSPSFSLALAARLVFELAGALSDNRVKTSDAWNLYQAKLKIAAANDGRQGSAVVQTRTYPIADQRR